MRLKFFVPSENTQPTKTSQYLDGKAIEISKQTGRMPVSFSEYKKHNPANKISNFLMMLGGLAAGLIVGAMLFSGAAEIFELDTDIKFRGTFVHGMDATAKFVGRAIGGTSAVLGAIAGSVGHLHIHEQGLAKEYSHYLNNFREQNTKQPAIYSAIDYHSNHVEKLRQTERSATARGI